MLFKPAKQGSHSTRKPFDQTLEIATPSAGRRFGLSRRFGGDAPKDCWLGKLLLEEAFWMGVMRRFGGGGAARPGDFPPRPRCVGDSLPYDPRKVVRVGVAWLTSQAVRVVSLAFRSHTKGTGDVRRGLQGRSLEL